MIQKIQNSCIGSIYFAAAKFAILILNQSIDILGKALDYYE